MNVSLTPKLEKYVRKKVASGLYNNASEVVREALRYFLEREAVPPARLPPAAPGKLDILAALASLKEPLRRYGIVSLALFGSFVHDAARPDSDVDVLIQVAPGRQFSLIDLVSVRDFLQERLGRTVDVVTRESLDPAIGDRVLREARRVF